MLNPGKTINLVRSVSGKASNIDYFLPALRHADSDNNHQQKTLKMREIIQQPDCFRNLIATNAN